MIRISGLRALSDRLGHLDITEIQQAALEHAAQMLQDAVQEALSTPPGRDHDAPWRRTGSLQASIDHRSDTDMAVIGSDDPVAIDQELGTRDIPPRPFLSTTAAAQANDVAHRIAEAVATALRDTTQGTMP